MLPLDENRIRQIVKEEIQAHFGIDRYIFHKLIQIMDGRNIMVGTTTGSKYGTETTQKIGFLGKTPVSRQATISDPSGGTTQDAEARTAINSLIDVLQAFGFIA